MSDEVKCPKGCDRVFLDVEDDRGRFQAVCHFCGLAGTKEPTPEAARAEFSRLAYFDPGDRLPTAEEEAAHRERWGEQAGWMVWLTRWTMASHPSLLRPSDWAPDMIAAWRDEILKAAPDLFEIVAHPHTNGRPVGWPNGTA